MVEYEAYYREGRVRTDVTPVFADGLVFKHLIADLRERCDVPFTKVAGIEALGFIVGSALAIETGAGFVPIRKGGKLETSARSETFIDYSGEHKLLEIGEGLLTPEDTVLLVDDWMETGSQARAAIALIEGQGARIAGIALLSAQRSAKTELLFTAYKVFALSVVRHEE